MLKRRVAAVIYVKDGLVVQSIGFKRFLPIGRVDIAVRYLNEWGADEIVLLDIEASRKGAPPDMSVVAVAASMCRVPLAVGGGVATIQNARDLIRGGADKICINNAALASAELISDVAAEFGNQCVIGCIDAVCSEDGYRVFDHARGVATGVAVRAHAMRMSGAGAGEILITSVDRDGGKCGFDSRLVHEVCGAVKVPVICYGGAGTPQHFVDVFTETSVHAACGGNFFHYTEHSLTVTKSELVKAGIAVRHDTHARYETGKVDNAGRLTKREEPELAKLLYVRIPKEVI